MTDRVDEAALTAPAEGHHARTARAWGTRGPCGREAAVHAHEREAFVRGVLDGTGTAAERVGAWAADIIEGELR